MAMPTSDLEITLVQASLAWHDAATNHAILGALLADVTRTDLIVLPEMFASGFSMAPQDCAQAMDGESVNWMRGLAREFDAAVGGSLVIEDDGQFVNRFVFVTPDGATEHYDKRHRFALAGEHEHYAAGDERVTVTFRGWRIVLHICYDLRFPVWCRHPTGCDLMLFVANWPQPRRDAWNVLLRARAIENQCYVAGVNRVGRDVNDKAYFGDSVLLDAAGNVAGGCADDAVAVTATASAAALGKLRTGLPFYRDADDFTIET